MVLIL
jgi:hypothetical protein